MHLTADTRALAAALLDPVRSTVERGLASSALALGDDDFVGSSEQVAAPMHQPVWALHNKNGEAHTNHCLAADPHAPDRPRIDPGPPQRTYDAPARTAPPSPSPRVSTPDNTPTRVLSEARTIDAADAAAHPTIQLAHTSTSPTPNPTSDDLESTPQHILREAPQPVPVHPRPVDPATAPRSAAAPAARPDAPPAHALADAAAPLAALVDRERILEDAAQIIKTRVEASPVGSPGHDISTRVDPSNVSPRRPGDPTLPPILRDDPPTDSSPSGASTRSTDSPSTIRVHPVETSGHTTGARTRFTESVAEAHAVVSSADPTNIPTIATPAAMRASTIDPASAKARTIDAPAAIPTRRTDPGVHGSPVAASRDPESADTPAPLVAPTAPSPGLPVRSLTPQPSPTPQPPPLRRGDEAIAGQVSHAMRPILGDAAALTDAALQSPDEPRVANHFSVNVQLGARPGSVDPDALGAALVDMLREAARRHGLDV